MSSGLKKTLLLGLSLVAFTTAAQSKLDVSKTDKGNTVETPVTTAHFDFAFGDQAAAAMKVPGATGTGWDISSTFEGLEAYCKKYPGVLKNKNVFVAICYSKGIGNLYYGNKLKNLLLREIGTGHIVIMGSSEMRAGKAAATTNENIKALAAKNPKTIFYGGPVIDGPPAGSKIDVNKVDQIYPVTAAEMKTVVDKANAALNAGIQAQKKTLVIKNKK